MFFLRTIMRFYHWNKKNKNILTRSLNKNLIIKYYLRDRIKSFPLNMLLGLVKTPDVAGGYWLVHFRRKGKSGVSLSLFRSPLRCHRLFAFDSVEISKAWWCLIRLFVVDSVEISPNPPPMVFVSPSLITLFLNVSPSPISVSCSLSLASRLSSRKLDRRYEQLCFRLCRRRHSRHRTGSFPLFSNVPLTKL